MAKVYQMLWDCQFCGTEKLLAKTYRACPKCKAPQDPAWRYFPSAAQTVEVQNYAFQGKDNVCAACNSLNVATADVCRRCGAPVDAANTLQTALAAGRGDGTTNEHALKEHWQLQEQMRVTDEALATGSWPEEMPDQVPPLAKPQPLSQTQSRRSRSLFTHSTPIEKFAFIALATIGCLIYGPIIIGIVLMIAVSLLPL